MPPRTLQFSADSPYRALVGVGGIGTGIFFVLQGDHTLGRNESRPAMLLDVRDYCKLHIITHYIAVLLGARPDGSPFHVLPIGRVGDDDRGHRVLGEMESAGIDTRFVSKVKEQPTLFSVCFQYPDGTGGNLTTSKSAASALAPDDIDISSPWLAAQGSRCMALAAPETSLDVRERLLRLATASGAFRAGAFTSSEVHEASRRGMFALLDLVCMNEDEAGTLIDQAFNEKAPQAFLDRCAAVLTSHNKAVWIVVSAGRHGAYGFADGVWDHCPAPSVSVASTAGAGDALMAGILSTLAVGIPFLRPGQVRRAFSSRPLGSALDLGVLLAAYTVTSPHTIHPTANLDTLLAFAQELGVGFSDEVAGYLPGAD
jgi:sugar/nucleoside kinase (ribokinase family)